MDDDNKSSKEKLLHIGNKQKTIKSGTKKTNSKFFLNEKNIPYYLSIIKANNHI